MKTLSVFFAFLIVLCAVSCHAAGPRVMVIPFEDKTGELRGIEDDLTAAVIEEVKTSGKYAYVSEEKFAQNWLSGASEEEKKMVGAEESRLKDLKKLRGYFGHEELGTMAEKRQRWGADLVIVGEIREDKGAPMLYTEIVGMNTGRFYATSGYCEPGQMKEEARRQGALLLEKSAAVQEIGADRQLDPVTSVVAYGINTQEGEELVLVADYTARRPDPELQNMDITPTDRLREGVKSLKVPTTGGSAIEFQYFYKDGELVSVNISTPTPEAAAEGEFTETLKVVSKAGHELNFTFGWKNGELKSVSAEPAVNPFSEVK